MKDLLISEIYRIDYPNVIDRRQEEPLGLFLQMDSKGVRFNIDNSGQNIEFQLQSLSEFFEYSKEIYGIITKVESRSELMNIKGCAIQDIYFLYIDNEEKRSESFITNGPSLLGLQIQFNNHKILTFYNQGDEGKLDFNFELTPAQFLSEDTNWKKQDYITQSLKEVK